MKKFKIIKKIGLFSILLMHVYSNYTQQEQSDLSRFDNEQDYLCKETVNIEKAKHSSSHGKEEVISDIVTQDSFSTGETRVTVTKKNC